MEKISLPVEKWQSLSMDWKYLPPIERDGKKFNQVLVIMDRATRMTHLMATSSESTSKDTSELFLNNIVRLHGIPRSIISDRDPRLQSAFWRHMCNHLNIRLRPSSSHHPQTNGQTERMNQVIQQLLIAATYKDRTWIDMLSVVEFAINNAPLVQMDYSPFFLNYG